MASAEPEPFHEGDFVERRIDDMWYPAMILSQAADGTYSIQYVSTDGSDDERTEDDVPQDELRTLGAGDAADTPAAATATSDTATSAAPAPPSMSSSTVSTATTATVTTHAASVHTSRAAAYAVPAPAPAPAPVPAPAPAPATSVSRFDQKPDRASPHDQLPDADAGGRVESKTSMYATPTYGLGAKNVAARTPAPTPAVGRSPFDILGGPAYPSVDDDNPVPGAQATTIRMSEHGNALKEGQTRNIISNVWFKKWASHTGYNNPVNLLPVPPPSPGPITNQHLLGSSELNAEVLPHMVEGTDYVTLTPKSWGQLLKWYGGGPAIKGKVIVTHSGLKVEVRQLRLFVCHVLPNGQPDKATVNIRVSAGIEVSELMARAKTALAVLPHESARVWMQQGGQYTLLCDRDDLVPIQEGAYLLVERMIDGAWPRDSLVDATTVNRMAASPVRPSTRGPSADALDQHMATIDHSRAGGSPIPTVPAGVRTPAAVAVDMTPTPATPPPAPGTADPDSDDVKFPAVDQFGSAISATVRQSAIQLHNTVGAPYAQCVRALQLFRNDLDEAADWLLTMSFTSESPSPAPAPAPAPAASTRNPSPLPPLNRTTEPPASSATSGTGTLPPVRSSGVTSGIATGAHTGVSSSSSTTARQSTIYIGNPLVEPPPVRPVVNSTYLSIRTSSALLTWSTCLPSEHSLADMLKDCSSTLHLPDSLALMRRYLPEIAERFVKRGQAAVGVVAQQTATLLYYALDIAVELLGMEKSDIEIALKALTSILDPTQVFYAGLRNPLSILPNEPHRGVYDLLLARFENHGAWNILLNYSGYTADSERKSPEIANSILAIFSLVGTKLPVAVREAVEAGFTRQIEAMDAAACKPWTNGEEQSFQDFFSRVMDLLSEENGQRVITRWLNMCFGFMTSGTMRGRLFGLKQLTWIAATFGQRLQPLNDGWLCRESFCEWARTNRVLAAVFDPHTLHADVITRSTDLVDYLARWSSVMAPPPPPPPRSLRDTGGWAHSARDTEFDSPSDEEDSKAAPTVEQPPPVFGNAEIELIWRAAIRDESDVASAARGLLVHVAPSITNDSLQRLLELMQDSLQSSFDAVLAMVQQLAGAQLYVQQPTVISAVLSLLSAVLIRAGLPTCQLDEPVLKWFVSLLQSTNGRVYRTHYIHDSIAVLEQAVASEPAIVNRPRVTLALMMLQQVLNTFDPVASMIRSTLRPDVIADLYVKYGLLSLLVRELLQFLQYDFARAPNSTQMSLLLGIRFDVIQYILGESADHTGDEGALSMEQLTAVWNAVPTGAARELTLTFLHKVAFPDASQLPGIVDELKEPVFLQLVCDTATLETMGSVGFEGFRNFFIRINESRGYISVQYRGLDISRVLETRLVGLDPLWLLALSGRAGVSEPALKLLLTCYVKHRLPQQFIDRILAKLLQTLQNAQLALTENAADATACHTVLQCVQFLQRLLETDGSTSQLQVHSALRSSQIRINVHVPDDPWYHDSETLEIRVSPMETLASVRAKVLQRLRHPARSLDFSYNGRRLYSEDETIAQLGLHNDDMLVAERNQMTMSLPSSKFMAGSMLAANDEYFDVIFRLLELVEGPAAAGLWSLLMCLPTQTSLLNRFDTQPASEWLPSFQSSSQARVVYAMQLVESVLDREATLPTSPFRQLFVAAGGLRVVTQVLLDCPLDESRPLYAMGLSVCIHITYLCLKTPSLSDSMERSTDAADGIDWEPVTAKLVAILRTRACTTTDADATVVIVALQALQSILGLHRSMAASIVRAADILDGLLATVVAAPSQQVRILSGQLLSSSIMVVNDAMLTVLSGHVATIPWDSPSCAEFFQCVCNIVRSASDGSGLKVLFDTVIRRLSSVVPFDPRDGPVAALALRRRSTHDVCTRGLVRVATECVRAADPLHAVLLPDTGAEEMVLQLFVRLLQSVPTAQDKTAWPLAASLPTRHCAAHLVELLMRRAPAAVGAYAAKMSEAIASVPEFDGWDYDASSELRAECGFVGLRNQGCTCYQNAMLQQFYMYPKFRQAILSTRLPSPGDMADSSPARDTALSITHQVQRTFYFLQESALRCYDPRPLVEACRGLRLANDVYSQNDASEFCDHLLEQIEAGLRASGDDGADKCVKEFGGKLVTQNLRRGCVHRSEQAQEFMHLELRIKDRASVVDSLAAWVSGELMQGENQVMCEDCGARRDNFRRDCIETLPTVLLLHLKRFEMDFTTFETVKLNDKCSFPDSIDMRPYTKDFLEAQSAATEGAAEGAPVPVDTPSDDWYDLKGILVHQGTAAGGHYYSYIVDRATGLWYKFNDAVVTPFNPACIEEECFGGTRTEKLPEWPYTETVDTDIDHNAFMLFYERRTVASAAAPPPSPSESTQQSAAAMSFDEDVWTSGQQFMRRAQLFDEATGAMARRVLCATFGAVIDVAAAPTGVLSDAAAAAAALAAEDDALPPSNADDVHGPPPLIPSRSSDGGTAAPPTPPSNTNVGASAPALARAVSEEASLQEYGSLCLSTDDQLLVATFCVRYFLNVTLRGRDSGIERTLWMRSMEACMHADQRVAERFLSAVVQPGVLQLYILDSTSNIARVAFCNTLFNAVEVMAAAEASQLAAATAAAGGGATLPPCHIASVLDGLLELMPYSAERWRYFDEYLRLLFRLVGVPAVRDYALARDMLAQCVHYVLADASPSLDYPRLKAWSSRGYSLTTTSGPDLSMMMRTIERLYCTSNARLPPRSATLISCGELYRVLVKELEYADVADRMLRRACTDNLELSNNAMREILKCLGDEFLPAPKFATAGKLLSVLLSIEDSHQGARLNMAMSPDTGIVKLAKTASRPLLSRDTWSMKHTYALLRKFVDLHQQFESVRDWCATHRDTFTWMVDWLRDNSLDPFLGGSRITGSRDPVKAATLRSLQVMAGLAPAQPPSPVPSTLLPPLRETTSYSDDDEPPMDDIPGFGDASGSTSV